MSNVSHMPHIDLNVPMYRSHKVVRALQIKSCSPHATAQGKYHLEFNDDRHPPRTIGSEMVNRYMPVSGDYLVIYDDQYQSFSPRKNFEEGYTEIDEEGQAKLGPITVESIVCLKTPGSPPMAVLTMNDKTAECMWFDDRQKVKRDIFPMRLIKHFTENPFF